MSSWIFGVTEKRLDGRTFKPEELYKQRMLDGFWGLGDRTGNKRALQKGDRVVFYVGVPAASFVGTAVLSSGVQALSPSERDKFGHGLAIYQRDEGVFLEEIVTWDTPRAMKALLESLTFIENKANWGAYLQGGIRQIPDVDFETIAGGSPATLASQLQATRDLESESEFALETHLEQFMEANWPSINFGARLRLFALDDESGRQFPAGPWSIDFLCEDVDTHDLVVIELKRGKTSDAVVGQLLRYMSWVRKNVAREGQTVRGVIVARAVDDALRYAVMNLQDVTVLTYRVDFKLTKYSS